MIGDEVCDGMQWPSVQSRWSMLGAGSKFQLQLQAHLVRS